MKIPESPYLLALPASGLQPLETFRVECLELNF